MTTTTLDDAEVTEHPRLIRTYRTRAYLSRSGHVRLDDVLAQQCPALQRRTRGAQNGLEGAPSAHLFR